MRVNYNTSAMVACNALNKNEKALSASTAKLSSGYKINSAKDNPSGYALSRRMKAQLASLTQAGENASDGVNILETADGALSEVQDMLQRINELCVEGANGTLSTNDRSSLDTEVQQLKQEVQRVADDTQFNGKSLLDGTFDLRGYTNNVNVKVQSYSDAVTSGTYSLTLSGLSSSSYDSNGYITSAAASSLSASATDSSGNAVTGLKVASVVDNTVTLTGDNGFSLALNVDSSYTSGSAISVDLTGIGAMTIQVGANAGQTVDAQIPSVSLASLGITSLNALTETSATAGIGTIGDAIQDVSYIRSQLGAYQNRLESTGTSIDNTSQNMTAALSNITDVDMAEEYSEYSTQQVLVQASTSILAQANKRPAEILQLLQ